MNDGEAKDSYYSPYVKSHPPMIYATVIGAAREKEAGERVARKKLAVKVQSPAFVVRVGRHAPAFLIDRSDKSKNSEVSVRVCSVSIRKWS